MDLTIEHKNHQITFILKDKGVIKGNYSFSEGEDLSKNCLVLLDKFLKKCNTNIVSVENVELREGIDIGLTSSRIVKTIVQTLQFAR